MPFFGGIVGVFSTNNNLGPGSYNYTYVGGTVQTPSGSPPTSGANSFTMATGISRAIESSIWSIVGGTVLTPGWVNTDLSRPATFVQYYTSDNVLLLTGDPAAFNTQFAISPVVTLTFEGVVINAVPEPDSLALAGAALCLLASNRRRPRDDSGAQRFKASLQRI